MSDSQSREDWSCGFGGEIEKFAERILLEGGWRV